MRSYSGKAVDTYIRKVLEQDLSKEHTDNALTLLTTLTTIAPDLFPHESTFVRVNKIRPNHKPDTVYVLGITIFTPTTKGEERSLTLQKGDLKTLPSSFDALFSTLGAGYSLDDL